MKPFIKWAGGKQALLPQLSQYLPKDIIDGKAFDYYEPFLGGGAMLIYMLQHFPAIDHVIVSDINFRLINAYRVIKHKPVELLNRLQWLELKYFSNIMVEREKMYYRVRDDFNAETLSLDSPETECIPTMAAEFIFLNKTCFNGLYRENKDGEFNVSFGKFKNPNICDADNIFELHSAFLRHNVVFLVKDSVNMMLDIAAKGLMLPKNMFVYLDPPYKPLNSSSFTGYTASGWTDDDYRTLLKQCDYLTDMNSECRFARWMMSNSSNLLDSSCYNKMSINYVKACRKINRDGSGRGEVDEVVITNY